MERQDEPAVRGLIPGNVRERTVAEAIHSLHSARAHLAAARASLERAYGSVAEAADHSRHLMVEHGAEFHANLWMKADRLFNDCRTLHRSTYADSLNLASDITDLMDHIRQLDQGRV